MDNPYHWSDLPEPQDSEYFSEMINKESICDVKSKPPICQTFILIEMYLQQLVTLSSEL